MRTRTLLILAVCCGFAILLAGGIQLLRIADQESTVTEFSAVGERVEIGDMRVVVESFEEADGVATVSVRIGGTDDEDGATEFRLGVAGDVIAPSGASEQACGPTTVAEQLCELTFGVVDAAGGSRILVYRRGDEDARWELGA